MNIKFRRFGAYLIDYAFIVLLTSLIAQLQIINPYYDQYYEAYEKYEEVVNDVNINNAINVAFSKGFSESYQNVLKYGSITSGISIICYLLYFVGFQKWNNSQTLGKRMFNIKVLSKDNSEVSWLQMFLRSIIIYNLVFSLITLLLTFISKGKLFVILILGINLLMTIVTYGSALLILFRKDNRGIHDLVAGTKVVGIEEVK